MLSELANYLTRIEDLRGQVKELIEDLPVEALNWRPFSEEYHKEANSLAVLTAHICGAEQFWISEVVGLRPVLRNRELEFETVVQDTGELIEILSNTSTITQNVFMNLTPDQLDQDRQVRDRIVPVRWAILHIVDHTALHLGHMQLTRQLWAGGKNRPSPYWHQRLTK